MVWWSCGREPRTTCRASPPRFHRRRRAPPGEQELKHAGDSVRSVHSGAGGVPSWHRPPSQSSPFLLNSIFHRRRRPHHRKRGVGCYLHHGLHYALWHSTSPPPNRGRLPVLLVKQEPSVSGVSMGAMDRLDVPQYWRTGVQRNRQDDQGKRRKSAEEQPSSLYVASQ